MSLRGHARRQRGVALLGLLFALITIVLGTLLSAWTSRQAIQSRDQATEAALQQAKEAVLGYAAAHKTNPGYLSCPEQLSVSSPTEGQAGSICTGASNVLGRFPWRALKLDKLTDGSGEPLWYAVSSGFGSSSNITSASLGTITVDSSPSPVVAVIIAPGPPLNGQTRTHPSPTAPPQPSDYLDLSNSGTGINSFVSYGPSATFNDRIITITKADLLNVINKRILAEIRGNLTANGVLQYYNDHGNTFPPNGTSLSSLPFDFATKAFLTPWFSLATTTYSYIPPSPPQISLGSTTLVVKP